MIPQPRAQMVQLMALLAFTAAAWVICASAHASKPSGAALAAARAEAEPETDGGVEPDEEAGRGAGAGKGEPVVYEVKPGDSLSEIAEAHGVRAVEILAANRLGNPDHVEIGTKLVIPAGGEEPASKAGAREKVKKKEPEGVRITVPRGVTLSRIAEVYGIPWKRIAKANRLGAAGRVRAGQKLFIPGATEVREIVPCLKPAVELYRVRTDETRSVSLCRCNGDVNPEGLAVLSEIAAPPKQPVPFPLNERVAQLLQRVADAYPGKRIEIVSGQRPRKQSQKNESLHNKGRAIDFRVEGVPNRKLVERVRKLDRVGVGYYPNSVFIHLDSREKDGFWIDYSRPGEKAIYGRAGMTAAQIEAIRLARRGETTDPATTDVEAETDVGALSEPQGPAEAAPAPGETAAAPAAAGEAAAPIAVNVEP